MLKVCLLHAAGYVNVRIESCPCCHGKFIPLIHAQFTMPGVAPMPCKFIVISGNRITSIRKDLAKAISHSNYMDSLASSATTAES
jgi:hypothetical protein